MTITLNPQTKSKPSVSGKIKGVVVMADQHRPPIYRIDAEKSEDGVFELDDKLVRSVVLDGLYTQISELEKERLNIEYRRRGRNIEILLDEPFFVREFPGLPFYVLTFKGAGARSCVNPRCIIDPFNWPSETVLQHKRIWGGLDEGFAVGEADDKTLFSRGIFHTPYVAQNKIPEIIQREIYRKAGREKKSSDANLYQVVRLSMTNIRHSDFKRFEDNMVKSFAESSLKMGWTLEKWVEHLGKVNGKLTKECLKLAEQGKFLQFNPFSDFDDNSYITGEITDLEQVVIGKYLEDSEYSCWPANVMSQSSSFIKKIAKALGDYEESIINSYFEQVSETSGYKFTWFTVISKYSAYRDSQLQKFKNKKVHA